MPQEFSSGDAAVCQQSMKSEATRVIDGSSGAPHDAYQTSEEFDLRSRDEHQYGRTRH